MNKEQNFTPPKGKISSPPTADAIRDKLMQHCKKFKTSWVELGQALYPVWKDKLFLHGAEEMKLPLCSIKNRPAPVEQETDFITGQA